MPCYSPLSAFRSNIDGSIVFVERGDCNPIQLSCGQCVGCRLERSRQWAVRCMHEASLYDQNTFITLTYDDAHVPRDGGLNHRHFQLFMKRLRRRFGPVRFYMCGEYGETYSRPHYHAILFNFSFSDLTIWKKSSAGDSLFRSAVLESLWPFGFSSIGSVSFKSAAYVARYIMKKQTGPEGAKYYRSQGSVDVDTGEVFAIRPEYNRMSLKPGIGAAWFAKYGLTDVFPHDRVVIDGSESKPPRYYDKLLRRTDIDAFNEMKEQRVLDISVHLGDNSPDRLKAKATVAHARLSQLKRGLLK